MKSAGVGADRLWRLEPIFLLKKTKLGHYPFVRALAVLDGFQILDEVSFKAAASVRNHTA
jgi:hypothetical protein